MDRKTRWICLLAGCVLLAFGIQKLYQEGDWVPAILGVLIVAFSISGILKDRQKRQ